MNDQIDHLRQTLHDLMQWIAAERLEATIIGALPQDSMVNRD
ncbi:MAG TPA: hypothetical protein VF701_07900 [Thermoanaerobaculia bacterium]